MTDTLKTLVEAQQELDNKFKEQGEALLKAAFNEFFKSNPEILAVQWQQYTPWFNDGDSCTFNIHGFYAALSEETAKQLEIKYCGDEHGEFAFYDSYHLKGELKKNFDALTEQLYAMEAQMERIFGDHVEIIVTPDKIEVTEYDHD